VRATADATVELATDFTKFIEEAQDSIVASMESLELSGKKFGDLPWTRDSGDGESKGYGRTRVLEDGSVFEKAAVSITVIEGTLSPERAKAMSARGRPAGPGEGYSAAALSLVFHTTSPHVPTFRADVRMFQLKNQGTAWFGGGADLTPNYLDEQDATQFHQFWKGVCDDHDKEFYPDFKKQCDDYFYLPARGERRGIGGIFFDDLEGSPEVLRFVKDVANKWMPSYSPIVLRHRDKEYTNEQKEWQMIRRGRYAEFNMLWDRGVRFGLLSGGDIERIMVSAPPMVKWVFNYTPKEGSEEAKIMEVLKNPREWA